MEPGPGGRVALHRPRQAAARHAFVESFNGRLRDECLNETLFRSLDHARTVLRTWRDDYNHVRPHSALRGLTPAMAAKLARETNDNHNGNPGLQP